MNITFTTLPEALESHARKGASITYIEGEKEQRNLPLEALRERALGILHHFQHRGMEPGSELILLLGSNEQLIDAFWACQVGGIVPVALAAGISDEHRFKLFRVFAKLRKPFLYTSRATLNRLAVFAETQGLGEDFALLKQRTLFVDDIDDVSRKGKPHPVQPADTAFIQFSSGSTSEAKGVVLSHRNLLSNIRGIVESSAMSAQDSFLSWMPLTHDMGLIGFHLTPLVMNVDHHLIPTEVFIRRPMLWLLAASAKRATILCSPNFGYKHLLKQFSPDKAQGLDLSAVRLVFNGAEPISAPLCAEFSAAMLPYGLRRGAMFPVYGLAEASLAVSFPGVGDGLRTVTVSRQALRIGNAVQPVASDDPNAVTFVGVGRAIEGCEVRIADQAGRPLADREIGIIDIKGENVTAGYYEDAAANQIALRGEGWLNTGDLGFLDAGELVVTGRLKDIIFVNGQNYFPQDLETIAEQAAGLELGKVAACGVRKSDAASDEILIFVLFKGSPEDFVPLSRKIRRSINERAGLEVSHVIPLRKIPKTTSGKIQRYVLGDEYLDGAFDLVLEALSRSTAAAGDTASENLSEIEQALLEMCRAVIVDKPIHAHDNIFELGTSSLTLAQIYERIEAAYPGRLEITDFFDYPTIKELAAYLAERLDAPLTV